MTVDANRFPKSFKRLLNEDEQLTIKAWDLMKDEIYRLFKIGLSHDEKGNINMKPVRIGATDGINTELKTGEDIQEGMKFISGIVKNDKNPGFSRSNTQSSGPGPPRLF